MSHAERGRQVIGLEIEGLQKVRDSIGPSFDEAVELMLTCLDSGGKIVVSGIGKNLHIGQKISSTLASIGSTSVLLNPAQAMHGDLGILSAGDVLLALSYSGGSDELLQLMPVVKRLGLKSVAMTGSLDSELARCCDVVVPVTVDREACPFNMAPTTSTTAMLAVGDALAMVLLEARGFEKEDYAKLHPGGAIGRSLLMRVSEIMRTGDRLAAVEAGDKVRDALVAMTRARSDSAAVLDGDGRVLGIFTDGDLRRHLAERADLLEAPLNEVMTSPPVTVTADRLAVEVLRLFEQHNIDDILVVDDDNRVAGAIDIQDLPKLKIM